MKKCPFCAEEIQDEAIKCKHCSSMLNEQPPPPMSAALNPIRRDIGPHPDDAKVTVYEGSPSWRAFFGSYFLIFLLAPAIAALAVYVVYTQISGPNATQWEVLAGAIPVVIGIIAFFITGMIRRSNRVRMTNRSVENESGVFSKKIDVMELWRIRDVRYKQSFLDRILGIAHIEVFTKDVTTPHFEIVGLPASREVFEKLRDNIEIQRQSQRVMGIIE